VLNLPTPDPLVLEEYDKLDGVPDCLVENAIFAKDEETVNKLIQSHVHDRQGMVTAMQRYPTDKGEKL